MDTGQMVKKEFSPLRWLGALFAGFLAWAVAILAAGLAARLFGADPQLQGIRLAVRGVVTFLLFLAGMNLALRPVSARLGDLGLGRKDLLPDVLIGLIVGIGLAALQFFLIIPNTGGAARSDVIASRLLIGDGPAGLWGAIILGWVVGGLSEEIFFRGHLFFTLRGLFRQRAAGTVLAFVLSVLLFAVLHAYQGWIGIVDTGVFAIVMAALYLWRRRLTASIVAHGLYDTILLVGLYLWY